MWDVVLEELPGADGESAFLVEAESVALRMDDALPTRVGPSCAGNPFEHQLLAQACPTHFCRSHDPADRNTPIRPKEHSQARHDLGVRGREDVDRYLIIVVEVLIWTCLLDHEHFRAKAQNRVEFVERKGGVWLCVYCHVLQIYINAAGCAISVPVLYRPLAAACAAAGAVRGVVDKYSVQSVN